MRDARHRKQRRAMRQNARVGGMVRHATKNGEGLTMGAKENSEIRELKIEELYEVTGAGVQLVRPPVGPAFPSSSPTSGTGGPSSGYGDGTSLSGGGAGGTQTYTGDPYDIHHLN